MADWTLALTKGVHIVSAEDAVEIIHAVQHGKRTITVGLDPFGAVDTSRRTTIAVAHVILLTENRENPAAYVSDDLAPRRKAAK